MSQIIPAEQYEALVVDGLRRVFGLTADQAVEISASRWPMSACDVINGECLGRGLELQLVDLTDFLRARFNRDSFDDGEPLTADSVGWRPYIVDELLDWCQANGRGEPAGEVSREQLPKFLTVEAMLNGLRSDAMATRLAAGFLLAQSLGVGLAMAGEHREDVEHLVAPQISSLIGSAIAGDTAAVDELAAAITIDIPARQRAMGAN